MGKKKGWIPVYREIQESWLWKDKPFSKGLAWVDLILLANWEDKKIPYKGKVVVCKRGDVNISMTELSKRWGWDRRTVKRFLMLLESDNMVLINSTTHRTTITLVNYDKYQSNGTTDCTTNARQNAQQNAQQDAQQAPITNKYNNINKDKEDKEGAPLDSSFSPLEEEDEEDDDVFVPSSTDWRIASAEYTKWKEERERAKRDI